MKNNDYKIQDSIRGASKDGVSRGWRRWVRARDYAFAFQSNAETNQHVRQYFARIDLADNFDFDTVKLRQYGRHSYDFQTRTYKTVPDFYTCSDWCAVLEAQIGFNVVDSEDTARRLLEQHDTISPSALSRKVTCHVCRRVVKKDGTTDITNRIRFRDPSQKMENVTKRTYVPFGMKTPEEQARAIKSWGLPVEKTMHDWKLTPPAPAVEPWHGVQEPVITPPTAQDMFDHARLDWNARTQSYDDTTVVTIPASEYRELLELRTQRDAIQKFLGL